MAAPIPQLDMEPVHQNRELLLRRAAEVFGSETEAAFWISTPQPALDDFPPVAFTGTAEQLKRVLTLLDQIDQGVFV
jgi:uncharacterized protein (DUF2384 family)